MNGGATTEKTPIRQRCGRIQELGPMGSASVLPESYASCEGTAHENMALVWLGGHAFQSSMNRFLELVFFTVYTTLVALCYEAAYQFNK